MSRPANPLSRLAARRQHQHRGLAAFGAHRPEHLEAIHAGQTQVENHGVGRIDDQSFKREPIVLERANGVPVLLERTHERIHQDGSGLDYQQSRQIHHLPTPQ